MEKKLIKCPSCGVVLEVKNSQDEAMKIIKCPKCSTPLRVRFKKQEMPSMDAETHLAARGDSAKTQLADGKPSTGRAAILCEGKTYPLHEGLNIVGRKASTSTADVQIDVGDRYMSRQNAAVTVRPVGGKYVVSIASLKNPNPILIGSEKLLDGDEVILSDGDEFIMGTTTLKLIYT